jgi:hypothetical protein
VDDLNAQGFTSVRAIHLSRSAVVAVATGKLTDHDTRG